MKNIYKTIILTTSVLCSGQLSASGDNVIKLTSSNFQTTISSSKPTLVKFWASWCGPCKQMAPEFEKSSNHYAGKIVYGKVNVDSQSAIANRYHVNSIPTTILFKNGKEVGREGGVYGSSDIDKWAEYALSQ